MGETRERSQSQSTSKGRFKDDWLIVCVFFGGGNWLIRKGQEGGREGGKFICGGGGGDCRIIGKGRGGEGNGFEIALLVPPCRFLDLLFVVGVHSLLQTK